jgi:transketolase
VEKMININELELKSYEIRKKVIDYHKKKKSPHLGSDLSAVEILTSLYYNVMNDKDSFILSKGHSSGLLYTILNDKGKIPNDKYLGLEEHPTLNKEFGIEATTGSLGHGLSIGLGMAIIEPKNRIYVLMGDGECDKGQVWEAARTASELNVKNLIGIVDCNGWQAFKKTDYKKISEKFNSFGWETYSCNGHSCSQLLIAFNKKNIKPYVILAETIKGKGVSHLEDKLESHYAFE